MKPVTFITDLVYSTIQGQLFFCLLMGMFPSKIDSLGGFSCREKTIKSLIGRELPMGVGT